MGCSAIGGLTTEIVGTELNPCREIWWGGGGDGECSGIRVQAVVGGKESSPGAARSDPPFFEEEGVVELCCSVEHLLPISHNGVR